MSKGPQGTHEVVGDLDREHGFPHPCKNCGFNWGRHRSSDGLCPGIREDGTLWPGQWNEPWAKGTTYKPNPDAP